MCSQRERERERERDVARIRRGVREKEKRCGILCRGLNSLAPRLSPAGIYFAAL